MCGVCGGPSNGGYYGIISVDEPVVEKDASNPDKIPTQAQWDRSDKILLDNLGRFNDNFENAMGREVKTEIYYTMNNWGDHPLTVLCDKVLPEQTFLKFIFGFDIFEIMGNQELVLEWFEDEENINHLLNNNTMSVYKENIDTLFTRMTKFANPNNHSEKNKKKILNDLKSALIDGDINWLTILLGMKAVPEVENEMLVYPSDMFNQIEYKTYDELLEEGWTPKRTNYAIDIDTSRVFTITPTTHFEKVSILEGVQKHVHVDRQIEIIANGCQLYSKLSIRSK